MTKNERQNKRYNRLREQKLCFRCEKPITDKLKCKECLRLDSISRKKRRAELLAEGFCPTHPKIPLCEGYSVCANCIQIKREQDRSGLAKLKAVVIEAYGGPRCACVNCDNPYPGTKFLSIDHVNNDGAEHRRKEKKALNIWRWLKVNNFPKGFQILCYNCNLGKSVNGGVCPHIKRKNYPNGL